MSALIIERYIYDVLNTRASMIDKQGADGRQLAENIIRDIDIYFADHMTDVRAARDRLAAREDPEGREMFAYIEKVLDAHGDAERVAKAAIARAGRVRDAG